MMQLEMEVVFVPRRLIIVSSILAGFVWRYAKFVEKYLPCFGVPLRNWMNVLAKTGAHLVSQRTLSI